MTVLDRLIDTFRAWAFERRDEHALAGTEVGALPRASIAPRNRSGLTGCWARDPDRNALLFVWSREDETQTLDLAKAA